METGIVAYLRSLSQAHVEKWLAKSHVTRRAHQYVVEGRVEEVWLDGPLLRATVSGSASNPYLVVLRMISGRVEAQCSCPFRQGVCWHAGAVLLYLLRTPSALDELVGTPPLEGAGNDIPAVGESVPAPTPTTPAAPPARPPVSLGAPVQDHAIPPARLRSGEQLPPLGFNEQLLMLPKSEIVRLLERLVQEFPPLKSRLETLLHHEAPRELALQRRALDRALRLGRWAGRGECQEIAADLLEILEGLRVLAERSQPEPVLGLYEELALRTAWRIREADDRDGTLARIVPLALASWSRGWAAIPSRDRVQLARQVFGWLLEDFGWLTERLVSDAKEALGPTGLEALDRLLRQALANRIPKATSRGGLPAKDLLGAHLRAALRNVARARFDLAGYLALIDPEGGDAGEILEAAEALAREGRVGEALLWLEQGETRVRGAGVNRLLQLKVDLLQKAGRNREAIQTAWSLFRGLPSSSACQRLLSLVGDSERSEWEKQILDEADSLADANTFAGIVVVARARERLLRRLGETPAFVLAAGNEELKELAVFLDPTDPVWAAQIRFHIVGRLLTQGQPHAYGEAQRLLEKAHENFETGGRTGAWEEALRALAQAYAPVREWYQLIQRD